MCWWEGSTIVPLKALSRMLSENLGSTNFWALYVSFLPSLGVLCHIIHIEPQMAIVCSNFLFKPFFCFWQSLTHVLSFVICKWVALMSLYWIDCHWLKLDKTHSCPNILSFIYPFFSFKDWSSIFPSFYSCIRCVIFPIFLVRSFVICVVVYIFCYYHNLNFNSYVVSGYYGSSFTT